jgi:peptidoglycan/LPS O-acetylase OafA/YrhL
VSDGVAGNPGTLRASAHIPGLDAIRFVCATIVAMGHFPTNYKANLAFLGGDISYVAGAFLGVLFNGSAAVIVFFVLSGFVIHLPYTSGKKFDVGAYYSRRYIRILPPLAMFIAFYLTISPPPSSWNLTVLWSIFCELIYYALYPFIRRWRLKYLTAASFAFALVLAFTNLQLLREWQNNYPAFGYATWLIGLPVWLSGCWVAENFMRFPVVSTRLIWAIRMTILALSVVLQIAMFHAHTVFASYAITLTFFTVPAALWIALEARYFFGRKSPWLDRLGVASYSLYLVHSLVLIVLIHHDSANLISYLFGTFVAAVMFYILIERSSHLLARHVGRKLTASTPATVRG